MSPARRLYPAIWQLFYLLLRFNQGNLQQGHLDTEGGLMQDATRGMPQQESNTSVTSHSCMECACLHTILCRRSRTT